MRRCELVGGHVNKELSHDRNHGGGVHVWLAGGSVLHHLVLSGPVFLVEDLNFSLHDFVVPDLIR